MASLDVERGLWGISLMSDAFTTFGWSTNVSQHAPSSRAGALPSPQWPPISHPIPWVRSPSLHSFAFAPVCRNLHELSDDHRLRITHVCCVNIREDGLRVDLWRLDDQLVGMSVQGRFLLLIDDITVGDA